ncbi:hypothetical protein MKW92_045965 [Papaver armeniacum]|nr:hypothetical protein MKW92_045965 [Papaver armeniacum]
MDFQLGGLSLSTLHHSSLLSVSFATTPYGGDIGYHTFHGSSSNYSSVLTNGGGVQIIQAEMASSLNIHRMLFGTTTSDQQMKETNDINESRQKQKPLQPLLRAVLQVVSLLVEMETITIININTSEWFFVENTNYHPTANNNNSSNSQENGTHFY